MINEKVGYARFERHTERKENGMYLTSTSFFDNAGELVIGPDGYARYEQEYDSDNADESISSMRVVDEGYPFYEERYYGLGGKPMLYQLYDGFSFAVCRQESTSTSYTIEYRGLDNKLISPDEVGVARIIRTYDGDNLISKAYYGIDGLPILNEYGFAEERWTYYAKDGVEYFDHSFINTDGNLMLNEYGTYAMERHEWSEDYIKESYYGADGNLRINPDLGYAAVVDEWDNTISRRYYLKNLTDKICVQMPGYGYAEMSIKRIEVDGKKGLEICYYDENGNMIVPPDYGFSRVIQIEDDEGRVIEQSFFRGDEPVYVETFPVMRRLFDNYTTGWENITTDAQIKASRIVWQYGNQDTPHAIWNEYRPFRNKKTGEKTLREVSIQDDNILKKYAEGIARYQFESEYRDINIGKVAWDGLKRSDCVVSIERYDESGNRIE